MCNCDNYCLKTASRIYRFQRFDVVAAQDDVDNFIVNSDELDETESSGSESSYDPTQVIKCLLTVEFCCFC